MNKIKSFSFFIAISENGYRKFRKWCSINSDFLSQFTKLVSQIPKNLSQKLVADEEPMPTDKYSFLFSLKATHRQDNQMIKFEIKYTGYGYAGHPKSSDHLISFGG